MIILANQEEVREEKFTWPYVQPSSNWKLDCLGISPLLINLQPMEIFKLIYNQLGLGRPVKYH